MTIFRTIARYTLAAVVALMLAGLTLVGVSQAANACRPVAGSGATCPAYDVHKLPTRRDLLDMSPAQRVRALDAMWTKIRTCRTEDSHNCKWNAKRQGNGKGWSFIDRGGQTFYRNGLVRRANGNVTR